MGNVVDIESAMPHKTSRVGCRECSHEWIAVFPADADTTTLECPKCAARRSVVEGGPKHRFPLTQQLREAWTSRALCNEAATEIENLSVAGEMLLSATADIKAGNIARIGTTEMKRRQAALNDATEMMRAALARVAGESQS